MTQLEVAQRLGKPQSYVAKIEGKDRKLDVMEFVALCEAIHQDPSELIRVLGGDNHDSFIFVYTTPHNQSALTAPPQPAPDNF